MICAFPLFFPKKMGLEVLVAGLCLEVLVCLDLGEIGALAASSRAWRSLARSPLLWRRLRALHCPVLPASVATDLMAVLASDEPCDDLWAALRESRGARMERPWRLLERDLRRALQCPSLGTEVPPALARPGPTLPAPSPLVAADCRVVLAPLHCVVLAPHMPSDKAVCVSVCWSGRVVSKARYAEAVRALGPATILQALLSAWIFVRVPWFVLLLCAHQDGYLDTPWWIAVPALVDAALRWAVIAARRITDGPGLCAQLALALCDRYGMSPKARPWRAVLVALWAVAVAAGLGGHGRDGGHGPASWLVLSVVLGLPLLEAAVWSHRHRSTLAFCGLVSMGTPPMLRACGLLATFPWSLCVLSWVVPVLFLVVRAGWRTHDWPYRALLLVHAAVVARHALCVDWGVSHSWSLLGITVCGLLFELAGPDAPLDLRWSLAEMTFGGPVPHALSAARAPTTLSFLLNVSRLCVSMLERKRRV